MISFEIYNDRACHLISQLYFEPKDWAGRKVCMFGRCLLPGFINVSTAEREHILKVFNCINNHGLEL